MERAAKSLGKLKNAAKLSPDELARTAWQPAVGKKIAEHTRAASLVRDRLVVEVTDPVWQKQLHFLRRQILENLTEIIGSDLVRDLEFRIVAPRRPVQPATSLRDPGLAPDEADAIRDPVMRVLYKEARKKASA